MSSYLESVVRRPISANPRFNFNPGFFFFRPKVFSRIVFSFLFRASSHRIVDKRNENESSLRFKFRAKPGFSLLDFKQSDPEFRFWVRHGFFNTLIRGHR